VVGQVVGTLESFTCMQVIRPSLFGNAVHGESHHVEGFSRLRRARGGCRGAAARGLGGAAAVLGLGGAGAALASLVALPVPVPCDTGDLAAAIGSAAPGRS
jgi:hypothetical protein